MYFLNTILIFFIDSLLLISSGDENSKKMVDTSIDELRFIAEDLHPFQQQELFISEVINKGVFYYF